MHIRPVLALLVLAGCSSPPRPPSADESRRRPANDHQAVELQVCRNELHNSRLGLAQAERMSEARQAHSQRLAALWTAASTAAAQTPAASPEYPAPRPNGLYVVHFGFGSAAVRLPPELGAAIVDEARQGPLVVLRGRTDGTTDVPAEARIARARALAVRDLLIGAGVAAERIRATWQASGDGVADNADPLGRAANRRVEIEIYRALPVALNSTQNATLNPASTLSQ